MEGMSAPSALGRLTAAHREAGGSASRVLIRRVWLGDLRTDLVERQREVYDGYAAPATGFGDDQTVSADDPVQLAHRLEEAVREAGADALNLRVHLPGMAPEVVRRQIVRLGEEVLPTLRARQAGRT
jgi:hypothetical protein